MSFLVNSYRFGGHGTWTPAEISTSLWLDAADDSTVILAGNQVKEWHDKSGNNNHATTSGSTVRYTPHTSIDFDGTTTSQLMRTPLKIQGWTGITAFRVFKRNANVGCFLDLGYGQTNGLNGLILTASGTAIVGLDGRQNFSGYRIANVPGDSLEREMGMGSYDCQFLRARANGQLTAVATALASPFIMGQNITIGGIDWNIGGTLSISAESEIIIFNSILPPETMLKVDGYLAHKWALTDKLPNSHPYKIFAP